MTGAYGVYGDGPEGLPAGRLPQLDYGAAVTAAEKADIDPSYLVR
jgi:hypothetical protein